MDIAAPTEAAAVPAPAEVTPAPVTVTESTAAPAADSTAASESATPQSSPSLLSSAAGKTPDQPAPAAEPTPDAKAADAPKEQPVKPDDPGKTEVKADAATDPATKDATATAPPALASLEDLKLPEGMKLDGESGKALVDLINNGELARKDLQQGLFDLHVKEANRIVGEVVKNQRKVWDDLNAGWKNDLRNDPELGGNRLDTSLSMAKAVLEENLSPDDVRDFLKHADNNGMGNFPIFIRLLNNLGRKLNIFEDSIVQSNPKAPPSKGPGNRGWYGNTPTMGGNAP